MSGVVVIYADERDPVAALARSIAGVKVLHIDLICQHMERARWPEVCQCTLDFSVYGISSAVVFNRVFGLRGSKAWAILKSKGLHEGWLHYFIAQATSNAVVRVHDIGQRGISRSLLPLNTQWYMINHAMPDVRTPVFAFGFNGAGPTFEHLRSPLLKSIWSFNAWGKERYITEVETRLNKFYVDRPEGVAMIVSFVGKVHQTYFPGKVEAVSQLLIDRLVDVCQREFVSEVGEIVAFAGQDGKLTFCACSPYLGFSSKQSNFQEALKAYCRRFMVSVA